MGIYKKVYFSKGNLQYNVGENAQTKWRFAPTQYDKCFDDGNHYSSEEYIKADHEGWTGHEGWIDLFGWGTWLNGNGIEEPYETQTDDATTYKWSGNSAIGEDWYTLTTEEFRYLFSYGNYTNDTRANKYGEGKVAGVNGIILFPDVWTYPTDLTSSSTSAANFTTGESAWSNKYTADDWKKMEAAGAVFLPAAGYREGTAVYDVGGDGFYWSSSADDWLYAYRLFFCSDYVNPDLSRKRYYGHSVRLVRAL